MAAQDPGESLLQTVAGLDESVFGAFHEEDGVDDCGVFGFTHVWHRTSDGWKITRVLSYGH